MLGPCTDASRSDCWSCAEGSNCVWCLQNGDSSCTSASQCMGSSVNCPSLDKLAKWIIALIIVGAILVVLIPIIIVIICCCCVAGTAAAAASATERSSLVHHHHANSSA